MPLLYHCTPRRENAEAIMRDGFRAPAWRDDGFVFFANRPLIDHHYGRHAFEVVVDIPNETLFYDHEYISEVANRRMHYREFPFPLDVANRFPRRYLPDGEAQQILDRGQSWDWYPPGEPEETYRMIHKLTLHELSLGFDDFLRLRKARSRVSLIKRYQAMNS